nr:hypothetical protein [Brucella intermedia]
MSRRRTLKRQRRNPRLLSMLSSTMPVKEQSDYLSHDQTNQSWCTTWICIGPLMAGHFK